ncbi:Uncharacterised protein [uncultured archaeon]|nr:Uncharacterised protein [uncultured archaeon]
MTLKKKSGKSIRRFLVNENLFIAAIKNPKKETASLRLLLKLIDNTAFVLIGNEFLVMEMEKYAQVFESKRRKEILIF